MFRLEFFVEDKNLAKVLTNTAGLIYNLDVRPVVNAKPAEDKSGKVEAAGGAENAAQFVRDFVTKRVGANQLRLGSTEVRDAAEKAGFSPLAAYQAFKVLHHKHRWLKSAGVKGQYEILPHNIG